jgi:hypothetical protein
MRVSRQWSDLLSRKRSGYGHDDGSSPNKGGLALFCPACPQPGINTPPNWINEPKYVAQLSPTVLWLTVEFNVDGFTAAALLLMEIFLWNT